MTGRIVILPRFHCTEASLTARNFSPSKRHHRRQHRYGQQQLKYQVAKQPVKQPDIECPLNALLNITSLDSELKDLYRENSFLRHSLVPASVRNDRLTLDLQNLTANNQSSSLPTTPVSIAESAIRTLLGPVTSRLLVLSSLYRVNPVFTDSNNQINFDNKIRKAFHRGVYRQLWYRVIAPYICVAEITDSNSYKRHLALCNAGGISGSLITGYIFIPLLASLSRESLEDRCFKRTLTLS